MIFVRGSLPTVYAITAARIRHYVTLWTPISVRQLKEVFLAVFSFVFATKLRHYSAASMVRIQAFSSVQIGKRRISVSPIKSGVPSIATAWRTTTTVAVACKCS